MGSEMKKRGREEREELLFSSTVIVPAMYCRAMIARDLWRSFRALGVHHIETAAKFPDLVGALSARLV